MRIGFDAKRIFQNATGLGNYSRTVVKNLAEFYPENEYYLFTPMMKNRMPFDMRDNTHMVVGRGSVWRSFGIRRDIVRHNIDVFHGLSNEIPFTLKISNIHSVVTIHDLIFERFPEYYPGVDRKVYDLKSKFAGRHADMIIAASQSTKNDIMDFYDIPDEKIRVVYQSCDDIFYEGVPADNGIEEKYNLPGEFVLYVGSISERKNLLNICRAYLTLDPDKRVPCVVVGQGKDYAEKVKAFIAEKRLEKWFLFYDNVPTEHLPWLYSKALCFIYPSLYEGFGIPVLEAMVSGCPVITSHISSLPEVGGNAALYFNPSSADDIADKLLAVTSGEQLRNTLRFRGSEQIKQFDKKLLADHVMEVYRMST